MAQTVGSHKGFNIPPMENWHNCTFCGKAIFETPDHEWRHHCPKLGRFMGDGAGLSYREFLRTINPNDWVTA